MLEWQWRLQAVAKRKEHKESSKSLCHQNTITHTYHWTPDLVTAGLTLYCARIAVDQDFSPELFWCASRHSGFFYKAFDGFGTDTLGGFLLNKMDDLSYISRMLCEIVLCFTLFFFCKLWRPSASFFVIESSKMMCVPGIKPIIDGDTINGENCHQSSNIYALET